jgi:hypothetical protein
VNTRKRNEAVRCNCTEIVMSCTKRERCDKYSNVTLVLCVASHRNDVLFYSAWNGRILERCATTLQPPGKCICRKGIRPVPVRPTQRHARIRAGDHPGGPCARSARSGPTPAPRNRRRTLMRKRRPAIGPFDNYEVARIQYRHG